MKEIRLMFILSLFTIIMSQSSFASGIGISPTNINFEDILTGNDYEKELKIDNLGREDIIASIEFDKYKSWFKLSENDILISSDSSEKTTLIINTPPDIEVGEYETLAYVSSTKPEGENIVGVMPRVAFKIKIRVTDKEIIEGYIDNIIARDVEKNEDVVFKTTFVNKGNLESSPIADIIIKKPNGLEIDSFEKTFMNIQPYKTQTLDFSYSTINTQPGSYVADIIFRLDNKVLKEKSVSFRVLDESEATRLKEKQSNRLTGKAVNEPENSGNTLLFVSMIAVIGIIVVAFVIWKKS